LLFVGDDWAEENHDVELQDQTGRVLGRAKLPEGVAGIARLHAMIGEYVGEDDDATVVVGIETERGPWVQALIAAGYQVFAINPLQVARFRETDSTSGAKSDRSDAHTITDMVRTKRHTLRPVAGDSVEAEAVKVLTRAHKTLIWERTRHLLRLRHALREFFPAALVAFDDLTATDTLELLAAAPDPASAAALSVEQITAALKRARRHGRAAKADAIAAALRAEHLGQPAVVTAAYAATVRAQVAILGTLNSEIKTMEEQVEAHFGQHPDAEIYLSQPGLGVVLGARVLAEFGDDKNRYTDAQSPQELRRHQPDHPPIRQEEDRAGPLRPQRPTHRRSRPASLRLATCLTRRPRLLRPTPRPRHRPPRRATPARQPDRRDPARLPQDRHRVRRGQGMETSPTRSTTCGLTKNIMGCLTH
jgi:transposase